MTVCTGMQFQSTGMPKHPIQYQQVILTLPPDIASLPCKMSTLSAMQVFDMMGFAPSHYNKINIHIGGVYNDKEGTMARFAQEFKTLSPNVRARLTVENDDWPSAFAISDLMWLHRETGIPLVFDFHHWKFCPGAASQ